MSSFDWTLYCLILTFKVAFSVSIPLGYVKIKKLKLNILGLTRENLTSAIVVGTALATLLYLAGFYWSFYLFDYGWEEMARAKLHLKEIGYSSFILFAVFDSFVNLGVPEEMFFRGFLFSIIERRYNSKSAVTISSVAFALSHINRPLHAPLMLIFGFALSYCFYKLRNITSPIIAHALSNLIMYIQAVWM